MLKVKKIYFGKFIRNDLYKFYMIILKKIEFIIKYILFYLIILLIISLYL